MTPMLGASHAGKPGLWQQQQQQQQQRRRRQQPQWLHQAWQSRHNPQQRRIRQGAASAPGGAPQPGLQLRTCRQQSGSGGSRSASSTRRRGRSWRVGTRGNLRGPRTRKLALQESPSGLQLRGQRVKLLRRRHRRQRCRRFHTSSCSSSLSLWEEQNAIWLRCSNGSAGRSVL
jgi:hypothetical protein